tara:strand:- start:888 stop:1262 length:375 start_codon:yes stop_codon:yes gene_type:complete
MNKNPEKKFGILFFFVFVIIAFYPLLSSGEIKLLFLIPALIFLVLAFIKPILLRPLNFAWIKLGEILGKVIAPMVMFFLFFFIVTPIGLLVRLFGKDLLKTKFSKDNSYWIKREKNIGTMKKQF